MFNHLKSSRVNLLDYQEHFSKEFLNFIEKINGTKAILWDGPLSNLIGLITTTQQLKDRDVVKNLPIKKTKLSSIDVKNFIFVTRPELHVFDYIVENILLWKKDLAYKNKNSFESDVDFYLLYSSRKSYSCEKKMLNQDIIGVFKVISELGCDLYPIEKDVLSMEQPNFLKDLLVDNNTSCLYNIANSIITIQKLFGRIPSIMGKGDLAFKIVDTAKKIAAFDKNIFNCGKGRIDQMVIFDRSIDFISVLATQLTYEGLIDEIFTIKQNVVQLPGHKFSNMEDDLQGVSSLEYKNVILNSNDNLFDQLRDKNFNEVGKILSKNAKYLTSIVEEPYSGKSVQDMKKYVDILKDVQKRKKSVGLHTAIAELIKEFTDSDHFEDDLTLEQDFLLNSNKDKPCNYIESLIAKKEPFVRVIRLICLQSLINSGLKLKVIEQYKRQLIQSYGIEILPVLNNLEKCGILTLQGEGKKYNDWKKAYNLIVDDCDEASPMDISYVHSFFAPLLIRLVEQSLKPQGWQDYQINILPGKRFKESQAPLSGIGYNRSSLSDDIPALHCPRICLVYFIGGCTKAEISALRFLQQQEDKNVEFLICSTNILNKNNFFTQFM